MYKYLQLLYGTCALVEMRCAINEREIDNIYYIYWQRRAKNFNKLTQISACIEDEDKLFSLKFQQFIT